MIVRALWCGLATLLLASAATPVGAQTLFNADPGGAESLVSRFNIVAWSTDDCVAGPFEVCRINAAYASSTAPTTGWTTFDNSGLPATPHIASNLAVGASHYYWLGQGGDVIRDDLTRSTGTDAYEIVSTMETPGAAGEVAASDAYVYWTENAAGVGRLFRAPLEGGPRELVVESPDDVVHDLQVDAAGRVYFLADIDAVVCCIDALHQIAPDGVGGFTTTISAKSNIDGYVLGDPASDAEIFVASRSVPGAPLIISRGNLSAIDDLGSWSDLYDAGTTGPPEIRHLALWQGDLFWHEETPGGGSPLLRMPRAGGSPVAISAPITEARDLQVAGMYADRQLYYRDGGWVYRVSPGASPFSRDIEADAITLEVTQAIQDSGHTVPLVEGKRTFVRAWARLGLSSDGASELSLFPAMLLEGRRLGVPLEGSPLRPLQRDQKLFDLAVDRARADNQFLFELPESWTSGTIELVATADPRDVEFETNEANNSTSRFVSFDPVDGICIDIIPILTTFGVESGGTLSEREQTFARARALMPVSDLVWTFRGGTPKSKPWTGEPYNFMEDDDPGEMLFHWWHDFVFAGTPSQCGSRRTIRSAVVGSAKRFGISSGSASIIAYLQSMTGGIPENQPPGGTSGLAHEVGHQLGQAHIGCPMTGPTAPDGPDGGYPYGPCAIEDDNDHIGFDVITKSLMVPFDGASMPQYQDYMSYQPDYWTSDYVYRRHFTELSSPVPSPPAAGSGPLLVAGLQRGNGSVDLGYAYELDTAARARAEQILGGSTQPGSDLRLRIYDVNDVLQVDELLRVAPSTPEQAGDTVSTAFFALVESQPEYTRLEVLDALGTVLASSTFGLSPPTVTILTPLPGDTLGALVDVQWEGLDADGDELEYRLLYSPDGGTSWLDLATTREQLVQVDMTGLPTGASVLFRVLASDGIRSDQASTGPFVVPNRPPVATILLDDHSKAPETAVFRYDEPLALRAHARDSDDGPIVGAGLQWTLVGPVVASGSGESFDVAQLQPGLYAAQLAAQDSGGLTAVATLGVEISPKAVPAGGALELDGMCTDPAYAADSERLVLRYEGGEVAEIGMARVDGFVHLCASGLPASQGFELVELRLDPDASADLHMKPDDLFVRVPRTGGLENGIGDGAGGDALDPSPLDALATVVDRGGLSWSVEIRVHESLLGSLVGLGVRHVDGQGSDLAAWPLLMNATSPQTWGAVELVPEPGSAAGLAAGACLLARLARTRRRRRAAGGARQERPAAIFG